MKPHRLGRLLLPCLALLATRAGAQEPDASRGDEVLALHRLELRPYGGWAAVPNSVTGAFVGADGTFRLYPFFALGGDFSWYGPFNRSADASPAYPLNEARWSADLDAYFVPWPAHTRRTSATGAFEPYLLAGVGLIVTRPVSVVDPVNRHFDQGNNLADFCVGLGTRFFVGHRVALTLELRDLVYPEKIESIHVAGGSAGPGSPQDPSTWFDIGSHVTNAVQLRLGASFFVFGG